MTTPVQEQFRMANEGYLAAVKKKDFGAFEKFLKNSLEFMAILPGGRIFRDANSFIGSQDHWYNGKTGSFDYAVESVEVSGDLGFSRNRIEYRDIDSVGKAFALDIYILMIFRCVENKWFLIHNQNTVIKNLE